MERLTAEDLVMLWPDQRWPQEVGCLAVLDGECLLDRDGRFLIEKVRAAVAGRLHLVPRLRQVLSRPGLGLGSPLWVDAPAFDISDHIRVRPLPAPAEEFQLLRTVEQLLARRLDRSRPLWEMWFLPGLPENRVGLLIKIHHTMVDGIAALATIEALLDATPDPLAEPAPAWTPASPPTARELFEDNLRRHLDGLSRAFSILMRPVITLRQVRSVWPAIGELISDRRGPVTSLDRVVGPDRGLALIRCSMKVIKQIARIHDATVNDVLLAIIAGGLNGLLRNRGECVDDLVLPVYVPVALRQSTSADAAGNLIAQMVVPLPIGASEPGERLRRIAAETAKRKARRRPSLGTLLWSGIARWIVWKVLDRQPVNVAVADLPGPPLPLYLAGAQLLEAFPVLPLIAKVSLGVGGLSYAGQFNIMAVADRKTCPDLEVFATSARSELQALAPWQPPQGRQRPMLPFTRAQPPLDV
jgi:diacylglycerol O-acyltransferase / wax synthase